MNGYECFNAYLAVLLITFWNKTKLKQYQIQSHFKMISNKPTNNISVLIHRPPGKERRWLPRHSVPQGAEFVKITVRLIMTVIVEISPQT